MLSITFSLIKSVKLFMNLRSLCFNLDFNRVQSDVTTSTQTRAYSKYTLTAGNALFSEKPPVSVTLRSANADRRVDALSLNAHSWAATNGKAEERCRLFRGSQGVSRLNIPTGADSIASIVRIFLEPRTKA